MKPETWSMIKRLVGFDTTSRESNLGLIEWVRDWLAGQGVQTTLTYDASGTKANLFATIGEGARPGIVLSGHTDVVPVDGQPWDTDPFKAVLREDRIFARGAADMKGFLGAVLAMTPRFLQARLDAPIHYSLSYDEEVGCIGVRGLIEDIVRRGIKPSGCIVGEPTDMQVVIANKGKRSFHCHVRGKEAHSAMTPAGVNAIEFAARIITHIRAIADRLRDEETRDPMFDVPFTTLQTGVITGGTAVNIVPRDCRFDFEFRYLPLADPDRLEREIRDYAESIVRNEMRAADPNTDVTISLKSEIPGLATGADDRLSYLATALARNRQVAKVAYATEAGLFQRAGIPSIICGPGSISEAHKPNEFITLVQVEKCEAFLERLIDELGA